MSDTVLVTGANSGIGLAAAIELAGRGFHAVGSVRSEEKARHVHAEVPAAHTIEDCWRIVVAAERSGCTYQ